MPTWHRCAPPILLWPWHPYNLLPRSCFTWIFFVDPHWWVPICVQHPTIYMPFRQIIMYVLQCPNDIHVHLCCFDLHTFLLRLRAATCPTWNCGRGTSLFRQELVFLHIDLHSGAIYLVAEYRMFLNVSPGAYTCKRKGAFLGNIKTNCFPFMWRNGDRHIPHGNVCM